MKKVEPKPMAVNPATVSELGIHQVRTKSVTLFEGKGYKAPAISSSIHRTGSQGKHGGK